MRLVRRYFAMVPSWSESRARYIDVIGGTETDSEGMTTAVKTAHEMLGKSVIVRLSKVSDTKPNRVVRLVGRQDEANARLIASAPLLLAALVQLSNCPDVSLGELSPETIKALDDARDAIAKATGAAHTVNAAVR
jgi:hypothetical protein